MGEGKEKGKEQREGKKVRKRQGTTSCVMTWHMDGGEREPTVGTHVTESCTDRGIIQSRHYI